MQESCPNCIGSGKVTCVHCGGTGIATISPFTVRHISDWKEIYRYRVELEEGKWVFRGQADANWPLRTSLERSCEKFPGKMRDLRTAEEALMREFRRRLHHYCSSVPRRHDDLEWLSLMRHHGSPTRLLDFNYSLLVACYFALEDTDSDCAVWAINVKWVSDTCVDLVRNRGVAMNSPEVRYLLEPISENNFRGFRRVFMEKDPPYRFVYPVNPFRLNERLTLQKGVFMCPGDISTTFEENLRAMNEYDNDQNVVKLVIPRNLRSQAIEDLYRLNITRATLFPGLDGFARSLSVCPPIRLDLQ